SGSLSSQIKHSPGNPGRFSPNKPRHYERYLQRMKKRRKEWGIL
ncbi:hypothetical protein, partial [Escherichia coli]